MKDGREHIAALKAAADPGRVAGALGLKGRGKRFACPVCHPDGDRTPSLSVTDKGFVCFKCGQKGDLLKLVEVAGKKDFPAAVAWLESLTGIRPAARPRGGYRHKGAVRQSGPGASWKAVPAAGGVGRAEAGSEPDPAVYDAFLTACRPLAGSSPSTAEGRCRAWLKDKVPSMTDALVEGLRLRFCGREYLDIIGKLTKDFGEDALAVAGLLNREKKPSFGLYYWNRVGFMVWPYLLNGRPVCLKARPPASKEDVERRGLKVRFLNTGGKIPVLYNVDALTAQPPPDKILVCEGDSDTWSALAAGFAAVGSPGAKSFKEAWVESFRAFVDADGRSRVRLVMDADKIGKEGSRIIAGLFRKAGLPLPLTVELPPGQDLTDFLKEGMTA